MVTQIQLAVGQQAKVYPRRRVIRNESDLALISSDGTRINAWFVSFAPSGAAVSERFPGHRAIGQQGGGRTQTVFRFQVEGWYSLDDENDSETVFDELAWAVTDRFNSFGKMNIVGNLEQEPADLSEFRYINVGNMWLCHYARIEIGFRGDTRPV